ncbi:MAG: hypothetical protein ACOX1L_05060 [Erysipelotrichaceae bacterium]|jgi:hypothetical protein
MKKRLFIIFCLFSFLVFPINTKAEEAPDSMRQEIFKEWDLITSFMEAEYSDLFENKSEIKECDVSNGLRYSTLNLYLLIDNEIKNLEELKIKNDKKEFLFYTKYNDKGIILIEMYEEKGVYSFGAIGGKANAFKDAIDLMSRLTKEDEFNLYRISVYDYLLTYVNDGVEYVIPFSHGDKLIEDYYQVQNIAQLPTVEDFLKQQKEKMVEIKEEIEQFQKLHPNEVMYGIDYHINLLPKKENNIFVYGFLVASAVLFIVVVFKKDKAKA